MAIKSDKADDKEELNITKANDNKSFKITMKKDFTEAEKITVSGNNYNDFSFTISWRVDPIIDISDVKMDDIVNTKNIQYVDNMVSMTLKGIVPYFTFSSSCYSLEWEKTDGTSIFVGYNGDIVLNTIKDLAKVKVISNEDNECISGSFIINIVAP